MKKLFSPVLFLVTLLLAAGLLFGSIWSIASAAESAQPDDTFYPLKILLENVGVVVFPNAVLDNRTVEYADDWNN